MGGWCWVPARPYPQGRARKPALTGVSPTSHGPCRLPGVEGGCPQVSRGRPCLISQGKGREQGRCFSGQPTAFWELMGEAEMDIALRFLLDFSPTGSWARAVVGGGGQGSPPVLQASSSLPSMQSASASQRQRRGMQCPLLHWNWSMSQRGVQSFCGPGSGHPGQTWVPRRPCSDSPLLAPLPTSSEPSAQSWSPSHFQRPAMQRPLAQENSLSEQGRGAGEGRDRPQRVGIGTQPRGHLQPLAEPYPPSGIPEGPADWPDDQNAHPIPCSHWLSSGGQRGTEGTHSPLGHTHQRGHGSLALPSDTLCVGKGGEGRDR